MNSPISFTDDVLMKDPSLYSYQSGGWGEKFIQWITDSNYRQAVSMKSWLEEQLNNPSAVLTSFAKGVPDGNTMEELMIHVLSSVQATMKYVSDNQDPFDHYAQDYWETGEQALTWKEGDCEDGAVLIYLTARLKGVPASRLMLYCGYVNDPTTPGSVAGHCCCLYIPTHYPLCWSFIDWCYYPTNQPIEGPGARPLYVINDNKPEAWSQEANQQISSNYTQLWFCFNELESVTSFLPVQVPDVPR